MIELQVRIHDKFSLELKIGYHVSGESGDGLDEFAVNTWIFVPNSLDINAQTYSKGQFYRDLKTNVRLITPVFLIREIAGGDAVPLRNLESAFCKMVASPVKAEIAEYEYQIKMFMAIFKSAGRNETNHIAACEDDSDAAGMCSRYLDDVKEITHAYRELRHIINVPTVPAEARDYFAFGDEFMSRQTGFHCFRLYENLASRDSAECRKLLPKIKKFILAETDYRRRKGFPVTETDSPTRNRDVIFRHGVLKRYIESDLFLSARVKRDGVAMEQVYLSIAAGVSMIFATIIAFSFQQKYGNFTMPLFVALVVSYMLKDRIKELMRYWFAYKLKAKYFDNRIYVGMKEDRIGTIREGFDFITDDKVPSRVMEIRSRSSLMQAENRFDDEKIILLRRMVHIDGHMLNGNDQYSIAGVNEIIRLHLIHFTQKMDNPETPLNTMSEDGVVGTVYGEKVYYLNFVMQIQHREQKDYRRFRLVLNREGILNIEHL